jgi:uncharacterized phage protein (TIGR02220 family)
MAKKRMISLQITDSDDFLEMPLSTQALYFHLLQRTDDEGFTNGVKKVMRMIGAREDDLKMLIGKRFVLAFDSGVVVIKHWLVHNTIRADRIIPTVHIKEKSKLILNEFDAYTEAFKQVSDNSQSNDSIGLGLDLGLDIDLDIVNNVEETTTIPYQKIISYLNQKNDTHFKATSRKTQGLIKTRFNEGYTLKDFYKVIDNKYNSWYHTEYMKYLRPETLFGTKFESYLNEKEYKQSTQSISQEEFDSF